MRPPRGQERLRASRKICRRSAISASRRRVRLHRFSPPFATGLREAGFVDGHNVRFEYRWAEGREERLPALAAELAARNVDVITTHGGVLVARAAKNARADHPDRLRNRPRPGRCRAGCQHGAARRQPDRGQHPDQRIERQALRAARRNGAAGAGVRDPGQPQECVGRACRRPAGPGRAGQGIAVARCEGRRGGRIRTCVLARPGGGGALLVANDPVFFSRHRRLVALAAQHAIPAIYEWREFVEAGGLMSYGTSIAGMHRDKGDGSDGCDWHFY